MNDQALQRRPLERGIAAPDRSFFIVQDEQGERTFTPRAVLHVDGGIVRDQSGRSVIGFSGADAALAPLRIEPVDAALGIAANVTVQPDGCVAYERAVVDPASGVAGADRVAIGRIALARFPSSVQVRRIDPAHVAAPAGALPHTGTPGDGFDMLPGSTAVSSLDAALNRLHDSYIALDALQSANQVEARTDRTAMDLLK